jgi:hypothetical protein
MPVDYIAAIVAFLAEAMSTLVSAVGADYVSAQPPGASYAVVHEGPEIYSEQSANDGENNPIISVIADGNVFVEFVSPTKAQARYLARQCVRILIDSTTTLACQDGNILYLRPLRGETVQITDIGAGTPGIFKRVVTVEYQQQFLNPGFPGG